MKSTRRLDKKNFNRKTDATNRSSALCFGFNGESFFFVFDVTMQMKCRL